MRLIDADKLWEAITTQIEDYCDIADLIEIIEKQATVDAVEVVRCKDCKWWKLSEYNTFDIHVCKRFSGVREEHDFCSKGERRSNETR